MVSVCRLIASSPISAYSHPWFPKGETGFVSREAAHMFERVISGCGVPGATAMTPPGASVSYFAEGCLGSKFSSSQVSVEPPAFPSRRILRPSGLTCINLAVHWYCDGRSPSRSGWPPSVGMRYRLSLLAESLSE